MNVELLGDLKKAIDKALAEVEIGETEEPLGLEEISDEKIPF